MAEGAAGAGGGQPEWQRLMAALEDIKARFSDTAATQCCQGEARVHLVYAHTGEVLSPDEELKKGVPRPARYEAAEEPRRADVVKEFIGSRLLWKPIEGAEIKRAPNLKEPASPTTAADGTLLRFEHTQFNPVSFKVEVKAPPDGDSDPHHPPRRHLCLSIPGSLGAHADVAAPAGSPVSAELTYPAPTQDTSLRLFSVSPGFEFEYRPGPKRSGSPQAAKIKDPWVDSPRGLAALFGWSLYEKSSSFLVGGMTRYKYEGKHLYGLQKTSLEEGTTSTFDLATTYGASLGRSRSILFKAVKEIEGACESVASYDGPKLSWGINQWIRTELWQLLAYIADFFPEAFARRFGWFGIGLSFTGRSAAWGRLKKNGVAEVTAYKNVKVYRLPCCGAATRKAINTILDPKAKVMRPALAGAIPITTDEDTTSYAMHYVFSAAGTDADIQRAQAEWMSFRISETSPAGDTVGRAMDDFLKSLGSNESAEDRRKKAQNALGKQASTLLAGRFSDEDADEAWTSWEKRCDKAGKEREKK